MMANVNVKFSELKGLRVESFVHFKDGRRSAGEGALIANNGLIYEVWTNHRCIWSDDPRSAFEMAEVEEVAFLHGPTNGLVFRLVRSGVRLNIIVKSNMALRIRRIDPQSGGISRISRKR